MSISSITSYLPEMPTARQMLRNASGLIITAVALCALSDLSLVYAGRCEDRNRLCAMACAAIGLGEPGINSSFGVSACLVGCDSAYRACIASEGR